MKTIRLVLFAVLLASAARAEERVRPGQGPPGTVTLPLSEYDRLVDRAAKPPKRAAPPPTPAVLARAEVRLRAAEGAVRASVVLEGEVFRTGPTKVPLIADATLFDARLAGRPLPLLFEQGMQAAIVTGPGPFSIALDWGASLVAEPGRASFGFPVPPAGSVHATLEVPGEHADVRLAPGLITRRTTAGGRTMVEATLDPGTRALFTWSAREGVGAPAARGARFLADLKTLVTVGEADLRMAALVDVTVVQGGPERFTLRLPPGCEVTGASGSSLDKTEAGAGTLALVVSDAARRRHQFLVTMERGLASSSFKEGVLLPSVEGAQRETGEVAIEGLGTMEVVATEEAELRRMDVREANSTLRGLAGQPLLAAFRYHRRGGESLPRLSLEVKRFPDAPVLAALAENARVTTLVTSEGRMLTEVALTVRNHAQPFLKLRLPAGATLLSADVGGEAVKPARGDDGTRVPLLRAGFRPAGPYAVSFVYLQPGTAFAKKGEAAFELPRMDVPVSLLEWELFLPERYKIADFGGNVLPASAAFAYSDKGVMAESLTRDEDFRGRGDAALGAVAAVEQQAMESDTAAEPSVAKVREGRPAAPSANVLNLQRRVAGVLPVHVDVPRAGASYRFVRPLVLDEETVVRFRYKVR